ncbi:NAD(P)-dependent oxidoreductase [Aestuariivirga sp.]|jgi:3-hydroxyisobutyrate dehydrogenase-like beta-hydroxyacid dehydrogenase|uniref:NAD(P)-dependent oxidoreductase n=1 Tax=Aestuariivirga sp. TaxID=2650926 RepID=UPI0037837F4A
MTIKRIGLIGVGLMGHGIGKNLLEKGYELTVMVHRNRGPADDLIAKGAHERNTPLSIAKDCDMVILCVTGTPEVEQAVYGEYGLLGAVRDGLVIADCSTAEPDSTRKIAADVEAKGGYFVDTPMTRTPKEAEAGKLGLMTGGPEEVIARIRPVLECFADTIVHAGPVGAAHQLKLINNFLSICHAAVAAEAITVAAKAGVDMKAMRDIVMAGGAASVMFGRLINVPLADDDSHAQFAIRNARKDLRYYTNMTERLPVTSFLAETAHQITVMADNMGYGGRFIPRLIDVLMNVNGMKK